MSTSGDVLCDSSHENFPEENSCVCIYFKKLTIYGRHNDVTFHLTDRVLHQTTVIPNVFFGHWNNMKAVVLERKGVGGAGVDRPPIF